MTCGSDTVVDGVCTHCGYEPSLNRLHYSSKEWQQMIDKGMVGNRGENSLPVMKKKSISASEGNL